MEDERCDSFNDGYDAHDEGRGRDSFGDDHVACWFEEGWLTACHYNAGGTYDELMDGAWRHCDDHQGLAPQNREPSPPSHLGKGHPLIEDIPLAT